MIPSVPKLAATVIVFRNHGNVLKLLMVKRTLKARFFAGFHVFPGGIYEESDFSPDWEKIAQEVPQGDEKVGRIACLRELFEETGLLISEPNLLVDNQVREIVQKNPAKFMDIFSDNSAKIPIHRVYPFQRWITPPQEKWRYDTYFYIATDLQDFSTSQDNVETTSVEWISPLDAINAFDKGSMKLAPPTWLILNDLIKYKTFDQLVEDCTKGFDVTAKIATISTTESGALLQVNNVPILKMTSQNGQSKYTVVKSNL